MKIELQVIELMKGEMISWKIYMIMEYCFDIVRSKEQMKIYLYFKLMFVLIVISSVKPKLGYVWFVGFGHRD